MPKTTSRREFIGQGCRVAAALGLGGGSVAAGMAEAPREFQRGGMVYRRLGSTDLHVSLLGFGSHIERDYRVRAPWGSQLNQEGQARRDRRIARAMDLGVNFFDVYANSGQWEPMARMVKGRRDKAVLSLKKELPLPTADIIDDGARLFGYMDLFRFVIYDEAELTPETLERWDVLRKGKAAGKIRAIGIATHDPAAMLRAMRALEGLDFIFFPFNFIHSRVAYSDFLPEAVKRNIGLLCMKPLGSGSITVLDPRRPRKDARPEGSRLSADLGPGRSRSPLLQAAVEKLLSELDRAPDETLAQASLRFVFSKPYLSSVLPGMWLDEELEENYVALTAYASGREIPAGPLRAAAAVAELTRQAWLPSRYRWLDQKWKADQPVLS
jgi:aryl-alcohol dehydrogenase-like predicted oxidoreductase